MSRMAFATSGGVLVTRTTKALDLDGAIEPIVDALDHQLGVLLSSTYEYPGRYTRWDIGFANPPLMIVSRTRSFSISALNPRGAILLRAIEPTLAGLDEVEAVEMRPDRLVGSVRPARSHFPEEERSLQASIFSVLRAVIDLFRNDDDQHWGLYGALGYDLAFQFEPMELKLERPRDQRDLVLFLPDQLTVVDHRLQTAALYSYDFQAGSASTEGLDRAGASSPYLGASRVDRRRDHEPGEYARLVRAAQESFRRGDLFEVVPGQTFYEPCPSPPSQLFRMLRNRNPAPYGALMNLGEQEYLVSASPEMYVRVKGRRVETCPISGTIARGADEMADADQIRQLLNSEKDTAELTMCTDVDRNDKSRICEPGSVRVVGRKQIEIYSKLIHTVDHVEGRLRGGFDALDAFLTHAWAVTVTGAPKLWAMRFIEAHEKTCRAWYGGAIGYFGFDGDLNTGLTLRTIRLRKGVAEVRAGATLLIDSVPEDEERECEIKASALLEVVRTRVGDGDQPTVPRPQPGLGRRVLLVDHEDSFVHTLANYLRQTGVEVLTIRVGRGSSSIDPQLAEYEPDLVLLSPGPGIPADFDLGRTIDSVLAAGVPIFGVCLGLQGLVERFGGRLGVLSYPIHGKPSTIRVLGGRLFEGMPGTFEAGRYHSLHALEPDLPAELVVTAVADDGVIMAVEHVELPVAAVQFHPESIMSARESVGLQLIENVVRVLASPRPGETLTPRHRTPMSVD